jgi:hypothetical protein
MQVSIETKEKMRGYSSLFFFLNAFKMRRKHNPMLIIFLFQISMQSKCTERKGPKKLGFFYFLPIKAELRKDAKRDCRIHNPQCNSFFLKNQSKNNPKKLGNTKRQEDFFFIS